MGVRAVDDAERVAALRGLGILDTPPEERFDRITRVAAALFGTSMAFITLVDADRQWFKSCLGIDQRDSERAATFCSQVIEAGVPLIVPDAAADPRFAGPPSIRFYAGQPLVTVDGHRVGTLSIADARARAFGASEMALLRDLARIAEDELNQRELSQALTAWRDSEQRFRAVFHDAAIGMTLIDRDGRMVEANAAFGALVGRVGEDLRGWTVARLSHPLERGVDRALLDDLFAGRSDGVRREKRYLRPDGSVIWGAVTASPLRDRDGRPELAVEMIEDITERKEVERLKDELVSVVGHELRTPLTAIRGSLGLIEAGIAGELPEEAREMVAIARSNTDRLVRLVNETLDLERLEAGRVDVEPRPLRAGELFAAAAQSVSPLAGDAGVELVWQGPDVRVMADADRIVQALVNLVGNAIKFSPAGATVTISVSERDDEALFSVSDEGRGIPADQLEAVFERFRQVDASDRREKGGTGLGLAISRAIVHQHAGRLWAESTPAKGATFRFTLPLERRATVVAVYDRRGQAREAMASAVRRRGGRAVAFGAAEALAAGAADGAFAAVLVAGTGALDVLDVPGLPVVAVSTEDAETLERHVGEVLDGLARG